jgi:RNA polymerase sigma-70 factor (ECF subfamily)
MAGGSKKAFAAIYCLYIKQVFYYFTGFAKDAEEARELSQDVFVRLWMQRDKLQHTDSPEAYFRCMVRNTLLQNLRKRENRKRMLAELQQLFTPDVAGSLPDHALHRKILLLQLEQAVAQLPGRQQQVFRLHKQEGLSYKQIACLLNVSVSAVNGSLVAAVKNLKRSLLLFR